MTEREKEGAGHEENGSELRRLKVAAYIRVSTDLSDQENSYETQERYFQQLLSRNEAWEFAGIYSDYGISGTSQKRRTGFVRILRHCREGRIDRIVTKSISRFARNTVDFAMAMKVLQEAGATIFFERENIDTADFSGSFLLTALAAIAQEESRTVSANINWGNQKRFLRGEVRNKDIYGYRFTEEYLTTESGYCYPAVEPVEKEAEVVRWIFQNYVEGMTFKELARSLNLRKIPRKVSYYTRKRMQHPAKGQLKAEIEEGWTSQQIGDILENERYTGDVLIQKTFTEDYLTHKVRENRGEVVQYIVRDHHPAIISRELFEKAGEKRKMEASGKISRGAAGVRALSGRLLCGNCGRFYNVRNTKYHPIWFCPSTARNNGRMLCHNEKVYEEQIVRMFRKAISQRFQLTVQAIADDVNTSDILSGCYEKNGNQRIALSGSARDFVSQMLARLSYMQYADFIERDRAFLRRQMQKAADDVESARRKKNAEALEAAREQENSWRERLLYMENYWEELEADHACREQAIAWMRELPPGEDGMIAFLNGMTDRYVRAFVLSVTVCDALHYTVHWFDDTRTEVEMYTKVDDYRRTSARISGRNGRESEASL